MFASREIYDRFAECYEVKKAAHLARILELAPQTVQAWRRAETPVPPVRLKKITDEMGIRWDWLIEGTDSKIRPNWVKTPTGEFDWSGINTRFLELFSPASQKETARKLGIKQVNISRLKSGKMHVPWDKLRFATKEFNVTWEWLLEGRDEKKAL